MRTRHILFYMYQCGEILISVFPVFRWVFGFVFFQVVVCILEKARENQNDDDSDWKGCNN